MVDKDDSTTSYRTWGAHKGLPRSLQNLDIFYIAVVTVILCVLAIIVSGTVAACFWILDKVL